MNTRVLMLGAALALMLPVLVSAAVFKAGNTVGIGSSEVVRDDAYLAGGSVVSAGSVTGDLYIGGGTVVVSGPVGGDAVVGGGNVTISGNVSDDVRAGGGNVSLQGVVSSDVVAGGGNITITGAVGGDILAGGGVVRIEAPVGGDIRIGGGEVYINAPVVGAVEIDAEKLILGPQALIQSDLTYRSPKEVVMEEGARVVGKVSYTPSAKRADGKAIAAAFVSFWFIAKFLMLLLLSLFLGLFFKRYATTAVHEVVASPWMQLGRGLVTVLVLPTLSILLLITVIGIPFGIFGLIALVALCVAGSGLGIILLGALLYKWFTKEYVVSWQSILAGAVVYTILGFVPILGWLVVLLFWLAAVGAIVGLKWRIAGEWR